MKGNVADFNSISCTKLKNYKPKTGQPWPTDYNYVYSNCNITTTEGYALNSSMQLTGSTGYTAISDGFNRVLSYLNTVKDTYKTKSPTAYTLSVNQINKITPNITAVLSQIQACGSTSSTLCISCNQSPYASFDDIVNQLSVIVSQVTGYWVLYH